jgi:glycosyltransferase involved in cell wall biosynthesis
VHSPTNRGAKGTRYIEEAIVKLKEGGLDVDFIEVENVPHERVREIYEKADLAVDQLLIGWYGGFAVEMMALGKPVICYIREEDLKFIPLEMAGDLPLINADPDTIYDVLKRVIAERGSLRAIGERSRSYVERWHDPLKIAEITKAAYES